ncbi:cytochrome P450 3A24-like [Haliotis rufescens]|uniref:cytochrome P450 3A24-like n=1 Tax=Haliotis rufescens TaxID=6454 RepID=UPI00201F1AE8|nr:cytochrome P450 3A24-like [Haliotis rufescens]
MECLSVELCSVSTCVVGFVGLVIAVYKYMTWTHDTFRKMGIPGPAPGILGNMSDFAKDGLTKTDVRYVREYGRVVGLFHARYTVMLVSDPEMVREICVKQFANFNKRVDPGPVDKSFRGAITVAEDDHWKFIRSVLSPIFSSSKIKQMVSGIEKCTAQLTRNLTKLSEGGKGVEMKSVFGNYTMDVMASTGFGMEMDCQVNADNLFAKNAKEAMKFLDSKTKFVCLMFPFMKYVFEALDVGVVSLAPRKFFFGMMNEVVEDRRKSESNPRDMLDVMLTSHKLDNTLEEGDFSDAAFKFDDKKKRGLTNEEVLANSVIFLLAGYDTTSTALTFCCYLLATNPECQERLVEEIDTEIGKDLPTYDIVMKLSYLDRVFSETLRVYPAVTRIGRKTKEATTIKGYHIPAGMSVNFPIFAMHHDPEFWAEPEKFDPDRFLPENKGQLHNYYYAPFGVGPKSCIGMRLATLTFKMTVVSILQHFRLETTPNTEVPPELEKGVFVKPKNGMFLQLVQRGR